MEDKIMTFDEMKAMMAKTMEGFSRIEKQQEENAKGFAELRAQQEKSQKEWEERQKKWEEERDAMRDNIKGIGDSNGKFSEAYYYNTLRHSMRFGGKLFDGIYEAFRKTRRMPDNRKIEGEYDVVMFNGDTVALIEIKYKVQAKHIEHLSNDQVSAFKQIFPEYANHKFYLGIAGMSFEHDTQKLALEKGIGILRPKGESVEILDENLKVY